LRDAEVPVEAAAELPKNQSFITPLFGVTWNVASLRWSLEWERKKQTQAATGSTLVHNRQSKMESPITQ
jgi:hypothetical protein